MLVSVKEQKNVGYPHGYDGSVVMVGSRHNEMRIQLKKNVIVKMQLHAVVNLCISYPSNEPNEASIHESLMLQHTNGCEPSAVSVVVMNHRSTKPKFELEVLQEIYPLVKYANSHTKLREWIVNNDREDITDCSSRGLENLKLTANRYFESGKILDRATESLPKLPVPEMKKLFSEFITGGPANADIVQCTYT